MHNLTRSEGSEIELFKTKLAQTLDQFCVNTATFTLENWERELGIPVDNTKSADYRRSVIKSKLRGAGTITINLIKNVAESFSTAEVEVIEDNANYQFIIKFVGTLGIPPNMADLQAAIEDIKPAHLGFTFEYTYNTYNTLSQFTHDHLALYTHLELREEVM